MQRADQGHAGDEAGRHTAPAGQRQEHQTGENHPRQHGEIAVHLAGQVDADQVEGKGPEQGDEDQIAHAASMTKAGDLSGCATKREGLARPQACQPNDQAAFRVAMSMTKRYFTSLLSMRS